MFSIGGLLPFKGRALGWKLRMYGGIHLLTGLLQLEINSPTRPHTTPLSILASAITICKQVQ